MLVAYPCVPPYQAREDRIGEKATTEGTRKTRRAVMTGRERGTRKGRLSPQEESARTRKTETKRSGDVGGATPGAPPLWTEALGSRGALDFPPSSPLALTSHPLVPLLRGCCCYLYNLNIYCICTSEGKGHVMVHMMTDMWFATKRLGRPQKPRPKLP